MNSELLRSMQMSVKTLYQTQPSAGDVELKATGEVDFERIGCRVDIPNGDGRQILAGLHPAAGGNGLMACSGEMLLQALVTCAGTTLAAVATSMGLAIRSARLTARGRMNFAGTMGVDRSAPVGLYGIDVSVHMDSDSQPESLAKLLQLTERYCVVHQTLTHGVPIRLSLTE